MTQLWVTNSLGGSLTNNQLSAKLRYQNEGVWSFRQFCEKKSEAVGKQHGDTMYYDKILRIDTKGGTLTETATIPENKWKVIKGSIVVSEYGNAIPWSHKLELLAEFEPETISAQTLRKDMKEVLDSAAANAFVTTDWRAVCTSTASTVFTTNSTVAATAAANMSDKNVRDMVDYMQKGHIPFYDAQGYVCIGSVNSLRGLYDFLQAIMQYTKPEFTYNFEVGSYYNCRFVRETGYLSNAKGSGSQYGEAVFFGEDAVAEGLAETEHLVAKVPDDCGRSKGVSWQGTTGFGKIWDQSTDDANSTGKGIERILYVTSA